VCILIRNILKGNLQPKFKGASVWPVFRLDRGLSYFARIALRAAQHAMEPYIRSESRLTDGHTLDTSLKLTMHVHSVGDNFA